jgi:hypothetical protein
MPFSLVSVTRLIFVALALHACSSVPSAQTMTPASATEDQPALVQAQNSLSAIQQQGDLSVHARTDGGVEIRWRKPGGFSSQAIQLLRRASKSRSAPRVIASSRAEQGVYRDNSVSRGRQFVYFMRVVDAHNQRLWQSANRVITVVQTKRSKKAKNLAEIKPAIDIKAAVQSGGPVISDIRLNGDAIALQWSAAADATVAGWVVYRLVQGIDEQFQKIARTHRQDNHFIDANFPPGKSPTYMISALDVSGNEIARSAARTPGSFARQRGLSVKFELTVQEGNSTWPLLKWQPLAVDELRGYLLFRRHTEVDDWTTVSPLLTNNQYLDRTAVAAKNYRYRVRALLTRGRYSAFSDEVNWR